MMLLLLSLISCVHMMEGVKTELEFDPGGAENITLQQTLHFPIRYRSEYNTSLDIESLNTRIVTLKKTFFSLAPCDDNGTKCKIDVAMETHRVGRASLKLNLFTKNTQLLVNENGTQYSLSVSVIVEETGLKTAMRYLTMVLLVLINIVMGCKIEWRKVKAVFSQPVALLVGLGCQLVIMPVLAFGLANAFFLEDGLSLGLLIVGTSPGGGISNLVAMVTGGDLDLSASMTVCSTLLAFGMMPLWLFTYGQFFQGSIQIPYLSIFTNLCLCTIPLLGGVLLHHKKPEWAAKLLRYVRPFSLIVMLIMIGLAIYSNLHVFDLLSWRSLVPCFLLAVCGLLAGALVAVIFKQPISRVKTIALEVGVQNTILAISVVQLSWVSPERDIIFIMPASVLILTLALMLAICVLHIILGKFSRSYRKFNIDENAPVVNRKSFDNDDKTVEKMIDSGDIILKENIEMIDIDIKDDNDIKNETDIEINNTEILHNKNSEQEHQNQTVLKNDMNLNLWCDEQKLADKVLNTDHCSSESPKNQHGKQTKNNSIPTPDIVDHNEYNDENYETQSNSIEFESEDESSLDDKDFINPSDVLPADTAVTLKHGTHDVDTCRRDRSVSGNSEDHFTSL